MQPTNKEVFDWDRKLVGYILGSFSIGYAFTQFPAGWAAVKLSPKRLIIFSIVMTIAASAFSPTAARLGWGYLIGTQIIKGLASVSYKFRFE